MRPHRTPERPTSCVECARRGSGVFCSVPMQALKALSGHSTVRYQKGQVVFHEDSPCLACYCLYSGRVKLFRMDPSGKEQIVGVARPGSFIGHHALWTKRPHSVTAQMLEDGVLCVIEKAAFWEVLEKDPGLAREVLRRTSEELEEAQSRLVDRSYHSARSRLAAAVLRLWEQREPGPDGRLPEALALSRQDLADLIGTAQETAIRLLSELKRVKAVAAKGSRVWVLRPELLRERSQRPT